MFVDIVDKGVSVEGLGGVFEPLDDLLVEVDAAGEGFVFGDDFALSLNRWYWQLYVAHFFPVKDLTGTAIRMKTRIAVKLRGTEPHHQIFRQ